MDVDTLRDVEKFKNHFEDLVKRNKKFVKDTFEWEERFDIL